MGNQICKAHLKNTYFNHALYLKCVFYVKNRVQSGIYNTFYYNLLKLIYMIKIAFKSLDDHFLKNNNIFGI
jgi:hypothetical protein